MEINMWRMIRDEIHELVKTDKTEKRIEITSFDKEHTVVIQRLERKLKIMVFGMDVSHYGVRRIKKIIKNVISMMMGFNNVSVSLIDGWELFNDDEGTKMELHKHGDMIRFSYKSKYDEEVGEYIEFDYNRKRVYVHVPDEYIYEKTLQIMSSIIEEMFGFDSVEIHVMKLWRLCREDQLRIIIKALRLIEDKKFVDNIRNSIHAIEISTGDGRFIAVREFGEKKIVIDESTFELNRKVNEVDLGQHILKIIEEKYPEEYDRANRKIRSVINAQATRQERIQRGSDIIRSANDKGEPVIIKDNPQIKLIKLSSHSYMLSVGNNIYFMRLGHYDYFIGSRKSMFTFIAKLDEAKDEEQINNILNAYGDNLDPVAVNGKVIMDSLKSKIVGKRALDSKILWFIRSVCDDERIVDLAIEMALDGGYSG